MRGLITRVLLLSTISIIAQQRKEVALPVKKNSSVPLLSFGERTLSFSAEAKIAAQAYSELKHVKIKFKRKSINTMMAARPKANFLFRKRKKREYVIVVSDKEKLNADALFNQMSNKAKVGVIGHELSHILCYDKMSSLELVWFGIKYYFNKKEIERQTDLMAVKKGFGNHIMEFNHYLHRSPRTNKKYLKSKRKYYLSSTEIEQKMQEKLYQ